MKRISPTPINERASQLTGSCPSPTKANDKANMPVKPPINMPGLTNSIVSPILPRVSNMKVMFGLPTASKNFSRRLLFMFSRLVSRVLIVVSIPFTRTVAPFTSTNSDVMSGDRKSIMLA